MHNTSNWHCDELYEISNLESNTKADEPLRQQVSYANQSESLGQEKHKQLSNLLLCNWDNMTVKIIILINKSSVKKIKNQCFIFTATQS